MDKPDLITTRQIVEKASVLPHVALIRSFLGAFPPQQVLNACYGGQHKDLRRGVFLEFVTQHPRSTALLEAIYGINPLSSQLPYVRLPSRAKRSLAFRLAFETRKRWKWVTSRLLHAWAFRPESFDRKIWREEDRI